MIFVKINFGIAVRAIAMDQTTGVRLTLFLKF